MIAQDVEKAFPELVIENAQGYKSVSYDKLVAPLIEVAKTHDDEIEALKRKNDELTRKLDEAISKLQSISK